MLPQQIQIFGDYAQGSRSVAEFAFRRYDTGTAIGWYHPNHLELQPLERCPALNAPLQPLFRYLAQNPPPINRCRIRIRVSPVEQLGCWIDAANTDILKLLREADWLKQLMAQAVVEMGQKHKRVYEASDGLSLRKPQLEPWFQSYGPKGVALPLWSTIAGFSQPSIQLNARLIERVLLRIQKSTATNWLEFGAGSGNFTLPMAKLGLTITATESSPVARKGLKIGIQALENTENVQVSHYNLQRNTAESQALIEAAQGLLLDPPRSGIGHMKEAFKSAKSTPQTIVYVACALKGFVKDAQFFLNQGYALVHIEGVAQFPNTVHCEWIAHFERQ